MILHPISRVQGNSGSTVNLVLLNPQPDAFAGLTSEVKQKVLQPVADNLIENYKVSDKIMRWGLDFKEDTDMHKMKKVTYCERIFENQWRDLSWKVEELSLFSLSQKKNCSVHLSLQCDMDYPCSFFQSSGYIRSYVQGQWQILSQQWWQCQVEDRYCLTSLKTASLGYHCISKWHCHVLSNSSALFLTLHFSAFLETCF